MPQQAEPHGRPAGAPLRRRGRELESAIFEAALGRLTAAGYAGLTMEGIAAAAQTGKAALYRRWPSKEELVLDALRASLPPVGPAPDTGSLRADLVELLARMRAVMLSEPGAAVRAIIGEADRERACAFLELVLARVVDPTVRAIAEILGRGVARGEVRPGAVTPLVADVAPALLLYRVKLGRGAFCEADAEAVVDEVLLPIVRP
ncbi:MULTISPECIES: TetR-like C-terminal domain-containing protein [Kitasatospora]|uniref:TetR/AcrR family transcriptional regulator n=1 Tax=Kitasatospora cystarginea TaxID=58350 RepID=A0ABN3DPX1_9ACTN